ncbi:WD repeat domain 21 [Corythoichthys intestinalis]|uniref:WD repeat domain 21 n=1 Tax=Corythoichthys intestinalis TaxID=161448 RepID=UPI0025A565BC|nr:WD repeat domain 21 [Corythoichthys intestinalis]XP_061806877.1 DDB1- and CUL4-associated factor 4-like [Nerophis lumbriciformis]
MKSWKWKEGQRAQRGQRSHSRDRTPYQGRHWRPSRDDRNWYDDAGPSSRVSDSQASTSSSSDSSGAPELPGFYFDPEKNRYFRLLPGHNNCNPLTREKLRDKEREKERMRMLVEDAKPTKKAPRAGLNASLLLQNRHFGLLPEMSYCRRVHEGKISSMRRHKLDHRSTDDFRTIVADSKCEQVFTVNEMSHGGCKYGYMSFNRNDSSGSLSVEMCDNPFITDRKVNSLCWATVNYPDSHVLLCLLGIADKPGFVTLLPASIFSNTSPNHPGLRCSFKISTAWCCAWCRHPRFDKLFSAGLSQKVILQQAITGKKLTIDVGSDVLAQQFCVDIPLLFNGSRSGEIFSLDAREPSNRKAMVFWQESAVTSLRILKDENYLVAADMSGQIKLWDIRVMKQVQEYKGHYNEYAYLPIHVSEPEGLLLAVGQDCYTRIWSLRDSHLLRTIPSPHPAANDAIPSIVFSSSVGGRTGAPGLLMAVRKNLYYFPYNVDDRELQEV